MNLFKWLFNLGPKPQLIAKATVQTPQEFHCHICDNEILPEYIAENICPILDSVGPARGFLYCASCGASIEFIISVHTDFISTQQIRFIGVPGPDYVVVAETTIKPAPKSLGWYLANNQTDLWKEKGWDIYFRNWLLSGLNALCAEAGALAIFLDKTGADVDANLDRLAKQIKLFLSTRYQEPLVSSRPLPRIQIGTRYMKKFDKTGLVALIKASRTLYETGYSVYHGKTLNEEWLRNEYPILLEKISVFAAFLPPQDESRREFHA